MDTMTDQTGEVGMRKKKAQQTDQVKIQRMLKWFEASLPEHALGKWFFEIEPNRLPLVDETEYLRMGEYYGIGIIVGTGSCVRCGQTFQLPQCGNYTIYAEAEQERLKEEYPTLVTEAVIAEAKEALQKDAERSGKCWGDIPKIDTEPRFYATLDSHATVNEI